MEISIIVKLGVIVFFNDENVLFDRLSEVTKCLINLSVSACANSLESFGI